MSTLLCSALTTSNQRQFIALRRKIASWRDKEKEDNLHIHQQWHLHQEEAEAEVEVAEVVPPPAGEVDSAVTAVAEEVRYIHSDEQPSTFLH